MHIAICDDTIADRKHMERLLHRESDKRTNDTGVFYLHFFGNAKALGNSPMQYDLFFIDIVTESVNGYQFALTLARAGVHVPMVLCISTIDYREIHRQTENPPANIFFLEKPIKKTELNALLDHAIALQTELPPAIELRTETDTYYVKEEDIVCGCANSRFVDVLLTDGRTLSVAGTISHLFEQLLFYSSYFMISKKAFVNVDYIDQCSFFKVTLKNGMVLKISPEQSHYLKSYLKQQ